MKARGYNLNKQDENISFGKSVYNIAAFASNARLILNELNTNNKEFILLMCFIV